MTRSKDEPATGEDFTKYRVWITGAYAIIGLVASVGLVYTGREVPDSIIATVSLSIGNIFGSKR